MITDYSFIDYKFELLLSDSVKIEKIKKVCQEGIGGYFLNLTISRIALNNPEDFSGKKMYRILGKNPRNFIYKNCKKEGETIYIDEIQNEYFEPFESFVGILNKNISKKFFHLKGKPKIGTIDKFGVTEELVNGMLHKQAKYVEKLIEIVFEYDASLSKLSQAIYETENENGLITKFEIVEPENNVRYINNIKKRFHKFFNF